MKQITRTSQIPRPGGSARRGEPAETPRFTPARAVSRDAETSSGAGCDQVDVVAGPNSNTLFLMVAGQQLSDARFVKHLPSLPGCPQLSG